MEAKETRKLARKLAMTGGYEVKLDAQLQLEELGILVDKWSPELENYERGSKAFASSIAARVLKEICSHPTASSELIDKVTSLIES